MGYAGCRVTLDLRLTLASAQSTARTALRSRCSGSRSPDFPQSSPPYACAAQLRCSVLPDLAPITSPPLISSVRRTSSETTKCPTTDIPTWALQYVRPRSTHIRAARRSTHGHTPGAKSVVQLTMLKPRRERQHKPRYEAAPFKRSGARAWMVYDDRVGRLVAFPHISTKPKRLLIR